MSLITQPGLTAAANWAIFGGGGLVLFGSFRQARSELASAWHKLDPDEQDETDKRRFGVTRGALRYDKSNGLVRFIVPFFLWWLSFARVTLKTPEGKKALDSATAWGLILLGSVFATFAGLYQAIVLTFPHV